MNIDYLGLGKRIRSYRTMKKKSLQSLAEDINIDRAFLTHVEQGDKIPSLETIVAIANALEVSTDDLLIDSIVNSEKHDNEVDYVLLDCTPGEVKILTKNLKNLRETIREFKIK